MTNKNLGQFLSEPPKSPKPSSGRDLGQFMNEPPKSSSGRDLGQFMNEPPKSSKSPKPSTSEEFLVPVEAAATAPKATIVALKAVKDYTEEDLVHPERVLLQQTGDALTRIQKETQDVWWKDARSEEYTEIGQERVPTPGRGRVFPTTEHRATGNKDFIYYTGAPTSIDFKKGLAREATKAEVDESVALLVQKGFSPTKAQEIAPTYSWKSVSSRDTAMKARFSHAALKEDRELSESYLRSTKAFLDKEKELRSAVEKLYKKTLIRYSADGKHPDTFDAQVAALRRANEEGTQIEKEILQHGYDYLHKTGPLLQAVSEEYEESLRIHGQIQKTGWVRSRKQLTGEIEDQIRARAPSGYEEASALAEEIVSLKGTDEQFEYYVSPSGYATTSGLTSLGKAALSDDYAQGTIKSGIYVDQEGSDVLSTRPFGGGGGALRQQLLSPGFKDVFDDLDKYQAAVAEAAKEKDPALIQQLIAYKSAYAALKTYEAGERAGTKRVLQGQQVVERKDVAGEARAERQAATKWARELVFLNDVLAHRTNIVDEQVEAASKYAGVSARAMAEVVFSRKLQASGAKSDEQAFDYGATFTAIEEHQRNIIAQSFGYADAEAVLHAGITVGEYAADDRTKLTYVYKNSFGEEIQLSEGVSDSQTLSGYIETLAARKTKKIINQELMRGKGLVFVRQATSADRAAAARASGVPFLYNTFVPRAASSTLHVDDSGSVIATEQSFKEGTFALDYTEQVFNSVVAYGGAVGHELWDSGTIEDMSRFALDDDGTFNWQALGGQQTLQHAVRRGETLEDIAYQYYGSTDDVDARGWIDRQRQQLDLAPGEQPVTGTQLSVHRDVFDVLDKATAVALGSAKDVNVWEEMDERAPLLATEQLLEMAEWSAHNLDVWGDPSIETKSAVLGVLYGTAGVYLDIRAPDAATGALVVAGKTIQAGKAYRYGRQLSKTAKELERAVDSAHDYDSLVSNIKQLNPGAEYVYEARVAAAMGVDENVSAQLRALEKAKEREEILLRRSELDQESLVLEVEKAEALAAAERSEERLRKIDVESALLKKQAYESVLDALDKRGAIRAAAKYKKEVETASVLSGQKDIAVATRDAFIQQERVTSHVGKLERYQSELKTAVEEEAAAAKAARKEVADVKVIIQDLRLKKRSLNAELEELKVSHRQELDDIAVRVQPAKPPTAEMVVRARNAGVPIDINRPPSNRKTFAQKVRRAEKPGKKDVNPDDVEEEQKKLDEIAKTKGKQAVQKRKKLQDAAKKRHAREKQALKDDIKEISADLSYYVWTGKTGKPRPAGSPQAQRAIKSRDAAKARLKKAAQDKQSKAKRRSEYRKSKEAKSIQKQLKDLDSEVFRATKALSKVESAAYARLAAYAPGINMAVLSKTDAVTALEETIARTRKAALDADEAAAVAKKKYKEFQTSKKTAALSSKEADRALDSLIKEQNKRARMEQTLRGYDQQTEAWRGVALEMAREIRQSGGVLKVFPDEAVRFVDPLAPGTLSVNGKTGERLVDSTKLKTAYEEMYGEAALKHFFEAEAEFSAPLKKLLAKEGKVKLSGEEVVGLQQLQAGLLRAREAAHPNAKAIATLRSIAQAKGDLDMMRVAMHSSSRAKTAGKGFLGIVSLNPDWWAYSAAKIENLFNPVKNRIGPIAGEYAAVLKSADFSASMINEDMRLISRAAHGGTVAGGAPGVVMETFNAAKRSDNSKKAANLYFDLVDGDVQELSTTAFGQVESPDLLRGLEAEVKSLQDNLKSVDDKLKVEKQIPGETLLDDALEEANREFVIQRQALEDAVSAQRVLEEKFHKLRRDTFTQASRLEQEADALAASTEIADNEYAVFNHYKSAMASRSAGDEILANRSMLRAAEESKLFDDAELAALKDRLGRTSTQAQEGITPANVGIKGLSEEGYGDVLRANPTGRAAAEYIVQNADSASYRVIAQRILPHLDDVEVKVVGMGDSAPTSIATGGASGLSQVVQGEAGATVWIRGIPGSASGLKTETVLHELLHAATQARLKDAQYLKNQDTQLAAAWTELNDLTGKIIPEWRKTVAAGKPAGPPSFINMDEVIAWGLTNKEFQDFLQGIKLEGEQTAFDKFVNIVAALLGISTREKTALTEVIRLTDDILKAPLEELPLRKWTVSGEAGEVAAQAMSAPTSKVFSDAQETILRNAAAAVETKINRPQQLRQEAEKLLTDFDNGTHPQQNTYDELVSNIRAAEAKVVGAEEAAKLTQSRLRSLEAGQLPEELLTALTGRQQVLRKQHELQAVKKEIQARFRDISLVIDEMEDVRSQLKAKPVEIEQELRVVQAETDKLLEQYRVAGYTDEAGDMEVLAVELAEVERRKREIEKRLSFYAEGTRNADGSVTYTPLLNNDNPLFVRQQKLEANRAGFQEEIQLREVKVGELSADLKELYKEVGFSTLGSATEQALKQERKHLVGLIEETKQKIKDHSTKPSFKEAEEYLTFSAEGNAVRSATVRKLHAEKHYEQLKESSVFVSGEAEFHAEMLRVSIEQEKTELARLLESAKPAEGTVSTVQQRISNARKISEALKREPLIDDYTDTLRLLTSDASFTYGMHLDKLAKAEEELRTATKQFTDASTAYFARRKALVDGDEVMPVDAKNYGEMLTKKNIPIEIAGRTTVSNTGMQVPWDDAVHQFRYTDLRNFNKKVEAAAKSPGSFSANLKSHDVSEAFQGLSRMWLPRGYKLSDYKAAELMSSAADLLASGKGVTFRQFASGMRRKTYALTKEVSGLSPEHLDMLGSATKAAEAEHSIAMGAYNVLRASLMKKAMDKLVTTHGAMFTKKQADAMNAFLGAEDGIKSIDPDSWPDVVEGMNRLGTPITQTHVGARHGLAESTTRLVASGATADGSTIYAREDLVSAINDVFNDSVKRADRFYRKPSTGENKPSKLYTLWKQSVTTGLILPNPHYWMNNVVGDFSQMGFTVGFGTAAKLTTMNLPHYVPVLGKHWQPFVSSMTHWASNKPVLGTVTNALFNPHLNSIWNRRPGYVTFKGGQTASYDDVYRFAVEDGILDSVVQEEFLSAINRGKTEGIKSTFDAMKTIGKNWNEDVLLFADFAQKRQRMALYVDLLHKGYTRKEAARLTLEALYDWKHGISQWEVALLLKISPFWRFWKGALKQAGRIYTDPLSKPDKVIQELMASGLGNVPVGSSAAQRMRQTLIAADRGGEMLYEKFAEDTEPAQVALHTETPDGMDTVYMDAAAFMPRWLLDYLYYGTDTLTDQQREFFDTEQMPLGVGYTDPYLKIKRGFAPGRSPYPDSTSIDAHRSYTHSHTVGPKFSTIESWTMFSMFNAWAVAGGYAATEAMQNGEGSVISPDFVEDFVVRPPMKLFGNPVLTPAIEAVAEEFGYEMEFNTLGRFSYRGGYGNLNAGEAYFLTAMGDTTVKPKEVTEQMKAKPGKATPGTEGKYISNNSIAVWLMRNTPFVMQLPTKVNQVYFRNPDVQRGLFPAAYGAFKQMGGLPYRERYLDPKLIYTARQYEIADLFEDMKTAAKDETAPRKEAKARAGAEAERAEDAPFVLGEKTYEPLPEGMSTDELLKAFEREEDSGTD